MSLLKVNNVTDLGDDAIVTAGALVGAGKILQVVSTTKTNTFTTGSSSFVDVTDLTVSITPSDASNKVLISAMVPWGLSATGTRCVMTLADGSNNILLLADSPGSRNPSFQAGMVPDTAAMSSSSLSLLHAPSTVSAFTYKIRMLVSSGNGFVNRAGNDVDQNNIGRGVATITAMEVAG